MAKVLPTKERETFIKNAEYIMVDKGARKAYEKFTEIVDDIKDLPEEEIEKSMMEFKDIIENKKGQLNGNRDEAQEEEEI